MKDAQKIKKILFLFLKLRRFREASIRLLPLRLKQISFGVVKMSTKKRQNDRSEILSIIEPFLDYDFGSLRHQLVDDLIVGRYRDVLSQRLSSLEGKEQLGFLVDVLSEMKAEMHYLKAAYIEKVRYHDPNFKIKTPEFSEVVRPDVLDIDMRGDITGSNWWHTEPTGRWAGPENQSSIQVPALGHGKYRLAISVVDEIDVGIIDGMRTSFNGSALQLQRNGQGLPCELVAEVDVPVTYRLPFWSIKFEFSKLKSPRENGLPDDRRLAIMLDRIRLTRLPG